MSDDALTASLGVAAAVLDGGRILLGRRLSRFGHGMWALPGGKLEPHEDPVSALTRELREETGLTAAGVTLAATQVDDFAEIGKRYTTRFYAVTGWHGVPANLEPAKCEGWQWFALDALPAPLFMIHESTLAALRALALSDPSP